MKTFLLWNVVLSALAVCGPGEAADRAAPFAEALEAAAISVERSDSILEYALLVGNGDINALVFTEGAEVKLMFTKNDVWDARLDSKLDPRIPKLEWIKRAAAQSATPTGRRETITEAGWGPQAPDSYHSHPYPCPRQCAALTLTARAQKPFWQQIRREGQRNSWKYQNGAGVMTIQGKTGASNGYSFGPLRIPVGRFTQLRLRISGSQNAKFFVDLMGPDGKGVYGSGWRKTPATPQEFTFPVRQDVPIERIILYTWTEDGKPAENRFAEVMFQGSGGCLPVELRNVVPESCPGQLDLRRGVARLAGLPGTVPRATVRALADSNVFLIETDGTARLSPVATSDCPSATTGQQDDVVWILQEIPGDLDWPGMSYAVALAGKERVKTVAIVTSREAKDPRAAAVQLARATSAGDLQRLVARHEAAWESFWSASGVKLDDPVLQAMWYRNLYFLQCVSKQGAIAPGLFASLIHDRPAWHGDYHTNYNIQQTFWSAYPTNHPDLAEPYDQLIRNYFPRARWLAREIFSLGGAYYPHVLFAYEPPDPTKCKSPVGRQYIHHVWGFTLGVAGFTVQPLWWHYKYAPDRKFLEETAYPAVRDVALWQAEFIDQCEGGTPIVLAPSVSPEHWGWTPKFARNRNSTFDIAIFRYVFEAAIEGAAVLGCDAELATRWKNALKRLPNYPTTKTDPLIVVDVEDAPPITYNIAVPAAPVFPGDVVTWWSPPAQKDLLARTIEGLKWNGNNSAIILSVARARLSMPGSADWVRKTLLERLRPNGTLTLNVLGSSYNDFGHYTEQFAASMAVSELLLQSVGDIIRVFPAWPADRDAVFCTLRAQGGFLVSAERKGGETVSLAVNSTVGGTLRLLSPWQTISVRRAGGVLQPLMPDARGVVQVETKAGEQLFFLPRQAARPG
jgi:hypothetical protein